MSVPVNIVPILLKGYTHVRITSTIFQSNRKSMELQMFFHLRSVFLSCKDHYDKSHKYSVISVLPVGNFTPVLP